MAKDQSRRKLLKNLGIGAGLLVIPSLSNASGFDVRINNLQDPNLKINHSVCRWCYADIPLKEFAKACKKLGISAIDLLKPSEWQIVQEEGLACSMATDDFISLTDGFNDPENHQKLQSAYIELIDKAADNNIQNVICFSGSRRGMDNETGWNNCVDGLKPLLDHAKTRNVTLVMELLNSKVDHPDYMADHTSWGAELAKRLDRPNFKLLYDIYHMQIMEGDIIRNIREFHPYINHYHTAGNPGRNEINNSQELNYPAIIQAIYDTGFDGYIAQEFIPTYENKLKALEEAIGICTI